jgi:hypothetical protein
LDQVFCGEAAEFGESVICEKEPVFLEYEYTLTQPIHGFQEGVF